MQLAGKEPFWLFMKKVVAPVASKSWTRRTPIERECNDEVGHV